MLRACASILLPWACNGRVRTHVEERHDGHGGAGRDRNGARRVLGLLPRHRDPCVKWDAVDTNDSHQKRTWQALKRIVATTRTTG